MLRTLFFAVLVFAMVASLSAGTVTGKINFKGAKPAVSKIMMNADPKCVKMHSGKDVVSEQVVVNPNNTLQNVFIYVKKGLEGKKFPVPSDKKTIDQKGCMYSPHVFGVMAGQPIEISNDDPTLHNIHALPKNSKQFNIAQPKQGMKMTQKFDKSEVMVKVKCEVHNWMAAYVGVLDHPFYAVSGNDGAFSIKNLPAGTYEIEAWHEKFGTQTMSVTVGASDTKTADFTFEGK
ncbi:MAG TPA: carboxypeptidase regulatory-like domain-containing protein [Bacteroidota bacterium]|nr:carboxypeptidase regulatory-like domain-containing protein [Bacteroidota bacterium]